MPMVSRLILVHSELDKPVVDRPSSTMSPVVG